MTPPPVVAGQHILSFIHSSGVATSRSSQIKVLTTLYA
jgi:hypothetical protein